MGSYLCMSCSTRISSFKLSCHYGYYRFMRYNTHHNSTKIPMYSALHQMSNPRCNSPHQFSRTLSSVCSKSAKSSRPIVLWKGHEHIMTVKQTESTLLSKRGQISTIVTRIRWTFSCCLLIGPIQLVWSAFVVTWTKSTTAYPIRNDPSLTRTPMKYDCLLSRV